MEEFGGLTAFIAVITVVGVILRLIKGAASGGGRTAFFSDPAQGSEEKASEITERLRSLRQEPERVRRNERREGQSASYAAEDDRAGGLGAEGTQWIPKQVKRDTAGKGAAASAKKPPEPVRQPSEPLRQQRTPEMPKAASELSGAERLQNAIADRPAAVQGLIWAEVLSRPMSDR